MPLTILGMILLLIRLLDAIFDPIIGYLSDRYWQHQRRIMFGCIPMLIAGYVMLFSPPAQLSDSGVVVWLVSSLILVYFSFSVLMINYYAAGTRFSDTSHGHTRVAAFRESNMLLGVLLASIIPAILVKSFSLDMAYFYFSLILAPLLVICGLICIPTIIQREQKHEKAWHGFCALLDNRHVRWILFIGFCNAIPSAITSTLFLFFTTDVLQAPDHSGTMLVAYFLSAAIGMPIWTKISKHLGKTYCLAIAMGFAIASFIWAWTLGAGDVTAFYIICILSGLTIGADAMLLPSMLSDAISRQAHLSASAFGIWNLVTKLTMATGAGIVLPFIEAGGYQPHIMNSEAALAQLSFAYALLPCLLKALAIIALYLSPLRERKTL